MTKKDRGTLGKILSYLEELVETEEEKMMNMEEHFSETGRYQNMEETVDNLREAVGYIESAIYV